MLTVSEWATRRGISRQAAYKAIERCAIPVSDGRVDPDVADVLYGKRTRARASARAAGGRAARPGLDGVPAEAHGAADALPSAADGLAPAGAAGPGQASAPGSAADAGDGADAWGVPDYQVSRARREAAEARLAELRLAEERRQLMRATVIEAFVAAMMAQLREGLLQVGARVGPMLMGCEDPARIQSVVDAEIHTLLSSADDTLKGLARGDAPAAVDPAAEES